MRKFLPVIVVVAVIAAIIVGVAVGRNNKKDTSTTTVTPPASSGYNQNNSSTPPASSSQQAATTDQISIDNFAFSPAKITVKIGTKVTWTNNDSAAHQPTADSGTGPASKALSPGDSYSFTYNTVGTFPYHCSIHPEMTGTVVVTQ